MTSARDKAIEALARIIVGEHDWPLLNDAEAEYAEQRAAEAFNANHPALVWEQSAKEEVALEGKAGLSTYLLWSDETLSGPGHFFDGRFDTFAAQAVADDHYIEQRLHGTKLWEQMEAMG